MDNILKKIFGSFKKKEKEIGEEEEEAVAIEHYIAEQVKRIKTDTKFTKSSHIRQDLERKNLSEEMITEIIKRVGYE